MTREVIAPRSDYKQRIERFGLTFHTFEGEDYWNESACYRLTALEVATLEAATNELHARCLDAVEHVVANQLFARLSIPENAWPVITDAWDRDPPALYGRFDLSLDADGVPKMLEFNADTPTSLLEAAVVQWHWLQDVYPEADQFNSIWECLVGKWRALKDEGLFPSGRVHFASADVPEDIMTTAVMLDTAHEAGLNVRLMDLSQIGWDSLAAQFVDDELQPIESIFKLYPWEWMLNDEFGLHTLSSYRRHQWIEPIWKMILSNKAILPILWELFPDHPNLLAAYDDGPRDLQSYVEKPILGREGSNVKLNVQGEQVFSDGPYDEQPRIWQAYCPLPVFDGNHVVIGSWVVDCESCGIGIRESDQPITEDLARFVPHYFVPEASA